MSQLKLDETDYRILEALQEDARISNVDLASRVGLSPSPCHRRVAAIEAAGLIRRYVALLDPAPLGLGTTVFVGVRLERQTPDNLERFESAIRRRSEVMECHAMTGDHDYLLRVVVPDIAEFQEFLMNHLITIPGVATTHTSFALGPVKYTTALPLRDSRP